MRNACGIRCLRRPCPAAPFTIGASRVTEFAVDTGLGIQGISPCGNVRLSKCRRCRHRRCRCDR